MELLEVGKGLGTKPAVDLAVEALVDGGEVEAEGWARVLGEDLGDVGDAFTLIAGEVTVGDEVEGRGAPEGSPPAGDGLRAGAILGGEQRDDGAEDGVGEGADEIEADAAAPRW